MTNKLSVNRIYEDFNIEGTDHSATTLRVSQGLQEGGPEGADTYVSKVMDQRNPQIVKGHGQQNSWNPHSGYTQNFHSPQVPLSRDDSDIWQLYLSTIGTHIISCGRCLSRNNSHSASNCHSVTYCNVCNNWSHSYSNCKKAPTNRS